MSETLERIPEAAHAFALLALPVCGPSVRFRNTLVRVTHGPSVTEKPQAFGPFGPLPSLSRGAEMIAAAQHRPRRFSVLCFQELRQRELFCFRLLSRAVNENDEVVRVSHHVECR